MFSDPQKNKVYDWENREIAPYDKSDIPFEQIQSIVNYVWQSENLRYPPKVKKIPKNVKTKVADATRLELRFGETTPTWVVLHELAHSMTAMCDGVSNLHNEYFLGMYMQLVDRYLHIPLVSLMYSAHRDGLKFKIDKAYCAD